MSYMQLAKGRSNCRKWICRKKRSYRHRHLKETSGAGLRFMLAPLVPEHGDVTTGKGCTVVATKEFSPLASMTQDRRCRGFLSHFKYQCGTEARLVHSDIGELSSSLEDFCRSVASRDEAFYGRCSSSIRFLLESANAASLLPRHNDGIKMCSLIFNGSNERILTPTPAYIINEVQSDGSGRESVKESKKISSKAEEKQQNRVLNRFVANYIEDFPPLTTTLRVSCYSYYCPALRMWPRFLWAAAKVWKRV